MYLLYRIEGVLKLSKFDVEKIFPYIADGNEKGIEKILVQGGVLPLTVGFLRKHKGFKFVELGNTKRKFMIREA